MSGQVISPAAFAARVERREREIARWRRRSRFIGLLRALFPAGILAIFLSLGAWLLFGQLLGGAPTNVGGPGSIHMSNARFLGRDNQGRAFVLTALEATRDNIDFQKIAVSGPALTIDPDNANPVRVSADQGIYREDTRMLLLNGHVLVRDGHGDSFATSQAVVDTVKGAVAGPSPVTGTGPMGAIHANSYAVYDRGQRLVFQGKVHSRLNAH